MVIDSVTIQNKTTEKGKLARKYRHLKADLAKYEAYLDSDNKLAADTLVIKEAMAGAATPLRRWRTRARGGGSTTVPSGAVAAVALRAAAAAAAPPPNLYHGC
mgnify:CR=1 FL=1